MITLKEKLYNKILILSRNKLLYSNIGLSDTFITRINLIFFHLSFLTIKLKNNYKTNDFRKLSQNLFDYTFEKIESNMREIGYGDVTVNKNMKFLVKSFYTILLYCENYKKEATRSKKAFFNKHLTYNIAKKTTNNDPIIEYFDKFHAFCLDLISDSVLQGELNFNYY